MIVRTTPVLLRSPSLSHWWKWQSRFNIAGLYIYICWWRSLPYTGSERQVGPCWAYPTQLFRSGDWFMRKLKPEPLWVSVNFDFNPTHCLAGQYSTRSLWPWYQYLRSISVNLWMGSFMIQFMAAKKVIIGLQKLVTSHFSNLVYFMATD